MSKIRLKILIPHNKTIPLKNLLYFLLGGATIAAIILLTAYTKPQDVDRTTGVATIIHNNSGQPDSLPVTQATPPQQVRAPKMPSSITFAGEALPLDNFDSRERFDRELLAICFRHSHTLLLIKRANRYFPIIEPILKEQGLPDDFKYLAVAESSLSNVVSPAGASGFWQFMKATATERKLEVNDEIDERYHLEKATVKACDYLKGAKKSFGSWLMASASYNVGGGRLRSRVGEQQEEDYFDLYLNNETSRYMPRIMAIKAVLENPARYGFHVDEEDLYAPMPAYKEITVSGAVASWADFAQTHNTTYRMIRIYNPWIRSSSLTNKYKKTYQVRVPK